MSPRHDNKVAYWLQQPHWFFVCSSVTAAIVALVAEGTGELIGVLLVGLCVVTISAWSFFDKPSLVVTVGIVATSLLVLGWTVDDPEAALFQSILIAGAVGWRIERIRYSLSLMTILVLLPLVGDLMGAEWGWWNWSVGTLLTWCLGRTIGLLEQTLTELTEARGKLMDSAAREERLRISRDVHDLVGHSLTAMLLNIRAAQRSIDTDQSSAKSALADAENIGVTGISDIRAVLVDLRSEPDDRTPSNEGLASLPDGEALMTLLQNQSDVQITTSGNIEVLQGPVAVALYRIVQECLTNMSKYAVPGSAKITLELTANEINIRSENALIPSRSAHAPLSEKTLGLISMHERALSLNGTFSAGIKDGTWQLNCRIPRHD